MARWMGQRRLGGAVGLWICVMLAGCVQTDSAAPVATRGATVLATAGPLAGSAEVQVTSAKGWRCNGVYRPGPGQNDAVRFPMTCSDDVETTALMQVDPADGRAAMLFSRKDGTSGRAVFAFGR